MLKMITLDKKNGINLKKGASICLEKNGSSLRNVCIGLNWGAIEAGFLDSLFGSGPRTVDLDASVSLMAGGQLLETVYFRNLSSACGAVQHSGDDLTGDLEGDDGLDNEVISIDLESLDPRVDTVYCYLNSYQGRHNFGKIPYAKIRLFERVKNYDIEVLANFNLSSQEKFSKYFSMVMAKLTKNVSGKWEFKAVGEPISPKNIAGIERYLSSYQASKL